MDQFEEWEPTDDQVTQLIMQRNRPGARMLLRQSAESAAAKKQFQVAAHFANELGSLSAADHLNDEALAAYLWAEKLDPENGTLRVSTANCLLTFLDKPTEAIAKIEEALPIIENDKERRYALVDALAIRAVAHLNLGDKDFAISQFREWSTPEALARVGSGGCDLRLAQTLLNAGILEEEVIAYLRAVLEKAGRQGNEHMVGEVARVLSTRGAG
jgi:tetratricopeptide (TPR) repeat protein